MTLGARGATVAAMTQHEFETAVLRLWTTTRIPLTRVNVQLYTDTPRDRIARWMNELTLAGIVEVDSDDEGEALWRVRGATRSATGPRTIDEWARLQRLQREVDDADAPRGRPVARASALARVERDPARDPVRDEKSLVASGILSFVFGPFGWLYAAPLKDAAAGILVVTVVSALLPATLAASLLGLIAPLSALAGLVYAQRYNATGQRRSLVELVDAARRRLPPGRG